MQLLMQMCDDARIPVFSRQNDRRVAGKQLLQAEDQDRDEEQRREDGCQTLNEIGAHESFVFVSLKITGLGEQLPQDSRRPRESGDPVALDQKTLVSRLYGVAG